MRLWRGACRAMWLLGLITPALGSEPAPPVSCEPLANWANPVLENQPLVAGSEQNPPLFLGLKPLEMALGIAPKPRPALPIMLRDLVLSQAKAALKAIGRESAEFEVWPTRDGTGKLTWVFARWREDGPMATSRGSCARNPWRWMESPAEGSSDLDGESLAPEPGPIYSRKYRLADPNDRKVLVGEYSELDSLYAKPLYADGLWLREDAPPSGPETLLAGWIDPRDRARLLPWLEASAPEGKLVFRRLPQPPRFNRKAMSFTVRVRAKSAKLNITPKPRWVPLARWPLAQPAGSSSPVLANWPENLERAYQTDVRILAGELEARFPISGKQVVFTRKNGSSSDHQLEQLADYLDERYRKLGLKTRRQRIHWNGIAQSNLIATIPASVAAPGAPVLLVDHIDTAFSEDVFKREKRRVSNPGADDNATATAALLRAAEILKGLPLTHEIWLTHLTGEEFPTDCLGARRLVERLLRHRQRVTGVILVDMIGFAPPPQRSFQIHPGEGSGSLELARVALLSAAAQAPALFPVVRLPTDTRSYLYNTDGIIFSDAGYPVVLFNEFLNRFDNMERSGYHDSTDLPEYLNWDYAISIVKTVLETTARLAL